MTKLKKLVNRSAELAKKAAVKAAYAAERDLGPCFAEDCQNNGDQTLYCSTCEAKGRPSPHKIQTCSPHLHEALREMKKHVLGKHPVNILRVTAAALRGESIE